MNKTFKNIKYPCDVSEWIEFPEKNLMNEQFNSGVSYDVFMNMMFIGEWKVMTDKEIHEIEILNKENRDKTSKLK